MTTAVCSQEIGAKKLKKLLALEPMQLFQSGTQSCQDEKYSECFIAFAIQNVFGFVQGAGTCIANYNAVRFFWVN